MEALFVSLAVGLITGTVSAVATIAAIKTEINWIKKSLDRAHARIDKVADDCKVCRS